MIIAGRLKEIMLTREGEQLVSFTTRENISEGFDELARCDVQIEIKKLSKHRSRDANAYAWALIDQIAAKIRKKKTEVYREAIREIGGVSDVVCVVDKAVDRLTAGWCKQGQGWQTEILDSKIEGCKNVVLYYGSSVYDSKQMSDLINIPTITPEKEQRMLAQWGRKAKKKDG